LFFADGARTLELQREMTMTDKFFPYAKQSIDSSDIQAVQETLTQERVTRGPKTELFEEEVAKYCEAKWAVSFNSATSALFACYFAAKVTEADKLISTPNTFIATVSPAMKQNIKPQLVDIEKTTGNLSLENIKPYFDQPLSRGRIVIAPVHFSGIAIDMKKLDQLIKTPEAMVIEDAAHALGSYYPSGEKVGSCPYCQMTVLSFHPAKTITCGEGGMVTTNDATLYHRLKSFRNNGLERAKPYLYGEPHPWYYEIQELGGNYHMTEMQAALGLSQLKRLDAFVEKRRKLVQRYRTHLENQTGITLFAKEADERTSYHIFVTQIDFKTLGKTRQFVYDSLKAAGIGTELHYIPLYRHPVFSNKYGDISHLFPNTETYYEQALTLPLYYDLNEEDVDYIANTLKKVLSS
jgi:UDP-4-amino-4,6-dideoxy-L-N-acetyl-beta-L-altrosamine transaminase